ncbi:MAG TPA: DUF2785 domain-containing protein [Nocardioides sp.]
MPDDRPLTDLTAELTAMLGSIDPARRDETAYLVLATWISRGVYDDLLSGLGDGMAAGLAVGLGEKDSDNVFRRSFSALVLAECLRRNTVADLLTTDKVLTWGDRLASWFLREQDLRGHVADKGWAHAVAHGADALGALAASPGVGAAELTVILDVISDRLHLSTHHRLVNGEPDRLAAAAMDVLRRNLVPLNVLEPWINRIASQGGALDPTARAFNAQAFLRGLNLQLSLGSPRPEFRSDLLLTLSEALRRTNSEYLTPR